MYRVVFFFLRISHNTSFYIRAWAFNLKDDISILLRENIFYVIPFFPDMYIWKKDARIINSSQIAWTVFIFLFVAAHMISVRAINCYQCATDQLPYDADRCGASKTFRPDEHALVDCGSDEAVSPGTMCLKYTQLSPRAFIWDKRWKSIIRRCAQISTHGHIQGCDWGFDSRGTYWEQCYCTTDGCNAAGDLYFGKTSPRLLVILLSVLRYITAVCNHH